MNTKFLASMLAVCSFALFNPVFGADVNQSSANQGIPVQRDFQESSSDQNLNKSVNTFRDNLQTPQPSDVKSTMKQDTKDNDNDGVNDDGDDNSGANTNTNIRTDQNFRSGQLMQRDFRAVPQPGAVDAGRGDMNFQKGGQFQGQFFRGGCG